MIFSMSRVIAISDIHGEYDKLKSLWDKLQVTPQDRVIFLGDYIDRGTQTTQVMQFVLSLKDQPNITFLRGNHEQMMLEFYHDNNDDWLHNGAKTTLTSFKENNDLALDFISFCKTLNFYTRLKINDSFYVFCHAGIDPQLPFEEQDAQALIWIREDFYDFYEGKDFYVVGHTPTIYLDETSPSHFCYNAVNDLYVPKFFNNIYCIDTGSFLPNGKITAFIHDYESVSFLQSN